MWMGGRELLPEDMLFKVGALKACAKEGRDCGMWVVMMVLSRDGRESEMGMGKRGRRTLDS